ncbi:hypothetical protein H4R33_003330 [Dimargaris cristalligena]|nr:hypothetical protein H4R33_003330 [Dimargaris cristalligena]
MESLISLSTSLRQVSDLDSRRSTALLQTVLRGLLDRTSNLAAPIPDPTRHYPCLVYADPTKFETLKSLLFHDNKLIVIQTIQSINSLTVGFPPTLRTLEKCRCLFAIHRLLLSPNHSNVIRMKCIEALCLYLLPEPECQPLHDSSLFTPVVKTDLSQTRSLTQDEKYNILVDIFGPRFVRHLNQSLITDS